MQPPPLRRRPYLCRCWRCRWWTRTGRNGLQIDSIQTRVSSLLRRLPRWRLRYRWYVEILPLPAGSAARRKRGARTRGEQKGWKGKVRYIGAAHVSPSGSSSGHVIEFLCCCFNFSPSLSLHFPAWWQAQLRPYRTNCSNRELSPARTHYCEDETIQHTRLKPDACTLKFARNHLDSNRSSRALNSGTGLEGKLGTMHYPRDHAQQEHPFTPNDMVACQSARVFHAGEGTNVSGTRGTRHTPQADGRIEAAAATDELSTSRRRPTQDGRSARTLPRPRSSQKTRLRTTAPSTFCTRRVVLQNGASR